jgi:predicted DNA binding protein
MQPLALTDVRPPTAYEPVRAEARRQAIELKRHRRVRLGSLVSLVFENRDTVRAVVEELLRAERIDDPERIVAELEVFNQLIPEDRELSATMFLEITDQAELAQRLDELRGVEAAVHLEVDGDRVAQAHEEGHSREDRTSSVHYLRFRLTDAQRAAFLRGVDVAVVADHPNLRARVELSEEQRLALAADLRGR